MTWLWDSNILRHYLDDHPLLLENLKKVPRHSVLLPIVVAAEQLRGRTEAILKSEPAQLPRAQELFRQTQGLLSRFQILYFDAQSLAVAAQLKDQFKTKRRYADVLRRKPSLVVTSYSFQDNVLFVVPASAGIFVGQSFRLKAGLRTSFS